MGASLLEKMPRAIMAARWFQSKLIIMNYPHQPAQWHTSCRQRKCSTSLAELVKRWKRPLNQHTYTCLMYYWTERKRTRHMCNLISERSCDTMTALGTVQKGPCIWFREDMPTKLIIGGKGYRELPLDRPLKKWKEKMMRDLKNSMYATLKWQERQPGTDGLYWSRSAP